MGSEPYRVGVELFTVVGFGVRNETKPALAKTETLSISEIHVLFKCPLVCNISRVAF